MCCITGEDLNEWIAMNTIELYNTMNLCYGIVSEFCTDSSCPQVYIEKGEWGRRGGRKEEIESEEKQLITPTTHRWPLVLRSPISGLTTKRRRSLWVSLLLRFVFTHVSLRHSLLLILFVVYWKVGGVDFGAIGWSNNFPWKLFRYTPYSVILFLFSSLSSVSFSFLASFPFFTRPFFDSYVLN